MSRFRNVLVLFLVLGGLAFASAGGGAEPAVRVGAGQLVRSVEAALAGAAQAARDPKSGLGAGSPGYASFWNALNGMQTRLGLIEAALASRDPRFLDLVDLGSSDLGALRVAWARTGAANPQVAEGISIASASFRLLRANYGREGIRHRQGGELTAAERRQFERVQRAQRRFAESLRPLGDRSRQQRDGAAAAELDRYRLEAERIAWAAQTLETYLNSLIAASEMRGEWEADAPHLQKTAAPEEWAAAEEAVEDLYVSSDIGHVFTLDLGTGLSHLDQETEVAADEALPLPAIQVFEPREESLALEDDEPFEVEGIELVSDPAEEAEDVEVEPTEEAEAIAAEEPAEEIPEEPVLPEEASEEALEEEEEIALPAATDPKAGTEQAAGTGSQEPAPESPPPHTRVLDLG
jgi:hypothetical protein